MKGTILGFDEQANSGHVRDENGKRYAFSRADLRTPRNIRGGEEVDFDAEGDTAKDIYVVRAASGVDTAALKDAVGKVGGLLGSVGSSVSSSSAAGALNGNAIVSFVLGRPAAFFAILILLACFMTQFPASYLMDSTGLFQSRIPLHAHSFFGTASYTDEWADAINPQIGPIEAAGNSKALTAFHDAAKSARLALLLLYLVPLSAAWLLVHEIRGTLTKKFWRISAAAAIAMPVIVSAILGGIAGAALAGLPSTTDIGERIDYQPVMHVFFPQQVHTDWLNAGTVLMILGVLSLLASFGFIRAPLAYLTKPNESGAGA